MTSAAEGWIDVLPKGWHLVPAKAAFTERREPNWPDDVHLTPSQIHGVLPQAEYMAKTGNSVVQNIMGQDNMKHVEPDDFIIHLRSFQGGIERSKYSGKVSTAYTVLKPSDRVVPSYFRWLLKSNGYIQELRTTTNQLRDGQSIKFADFAKVQLPCPPRSEQRAIADYLDRETARIDTLIEEQQQLIVLLRERRIAVPEGSVAGLPWTTPLRSVTALIQTGPFGSQLKSDEYETGGTPVINPSHLVKGRIEPDERVAVSEQKASELARHALQVGDVIAARRGELGRCAVVRAQNTGFLCGTGSALIRLHETVADPEFLALVFSSRRNRDSLSLASVGATMDNLNADIIATLRIPIPPLPEQRRIVGWVAEATTKIDTLITETERFIEIARERRAALITAAVTGQIDVQDEVA
ncbi:MULTISPECIES: restriction endonuclease subunit S [unclassified Rhodococcus (in: high G+C Gram-positive bacteria)]|uniref:restriction endonuclease subunit S n=1 Tax=unclassified Rhodococcus (in: high G+C Gram-positive bacteria) TaxID=192944 RepID=UPI000301DB3A|nr:restriction endonuclease subunit S [Rhodococcus sp. DK17]